MNLKKIVVCGAGTMGSGIAQVTATAGFHTVLYEVNQNVLAGAQKQLNANLDKLVQKGKLDAAQKEAILQRIHFTSSIQHCIADLIIEAIVEKADIKTTLFNQLAAINNSQTIFATNTSSLSVTQIGDSLKNPAQVAGLHFFNPAPLMSLVEIVQGNHTTDAVVQTLVQFTKALGKTGVVCKDAPGFIVNRIARPFYIEALRLAEAGLASYATIDKLLQNAGFKMGPFALMDLIGNDVNYAVSCSVYNQLGAPERLKPSYLQQQKVENNLLGKKTGEGYYQY